MTRLDGRHCWHLLPVLLSPAAPTTPVAVEALSLAPGDPTHRSQEATSHAHVPKSPYHSL